MRPSVIHLLKQVLQKSEVKAAFRFFETQAEQITTEQIRICSIPAPPFGEQERAQYLCQRWREMGFQDASLDEEGNCVALYNGLAETPALVLSAHLDTVFPPGTDFTVRRSGNKLLGPGIGDDGCGLAALIALAQSMQETKIRSFAPLLFVGTVGEEGEGDLRGVRHLLTRGEWAGKVSSFISLDGPGIDRITHRALGSRRYRVEYRGPGGHSWGDFGAANPIHATGRAIAKLNAYPIPTEPRTSFNVGRIQGGTSVNSIATESLMDVDLRSASEDQLLRLDAYFRRCVREAAEEENGSRRKGTPPLKVTTKLIGQRPSGETPIESPLVELALEATRMFAAKPKLEQASTDSNFPMSLGIPAVTIGAGGSSGQSHTLEEWYDPRGRDLGLKRALLLILGAAGSDPKSA